jgi:anhydromevalonate phosphate decarboxylase
MSVIVDSNRHPNTPDAADPGTDTGADTGTSLRSFLAAQEGLGRVDTVTEAVSPDYEVARRLFDHEGRIQLLENVGARHRVVGNVASSRDLVAAALSTTLPGLVAHIAGAMASTDPATQAVDSGDFQEREVKDPDLWKELAPVRFYPQGERAYLTAGIIAARSASHGMNYSFHRMMFVEGNRLAVRVVPRHLKMILDEGDGSAEVAVLLGLHPALSVAAACSGAPDLDELALAGRLLGRPLPVCDVAGLTVPAEAELVLRGRFTGDLTEEGPFVDITGTLDGIRQQPVLEIHRLWSRTHPLCTVILPGGLEHRLLMGLPQEPRIWNTVRAAVPALANLALTMGGCAWLHAAVALGAHAPGQAKNAGLAALAAHPSLKRVVVVDDDIDVNDAEQVEWAIATRVQADRDIVVVPGARGSSLDPGRDPHTSTTAKWIIDATMPPGAKLEEYLRVEPPRVEPPRQR